MQNPVLAWIVVGVGVLLVLCFAGFDLIVAADGVASSILARHADWFQPSFERYRNKFAWYGTTALIPALSLIFRQSEHGIFIAHCYQFSPTHSTFLVDLRRMDPAFIARYEAAHGAAERGDAPAASHSV